MIVNKENNSIIDMRDTMYPSYSLMIRNDSITIPAKDVGWATAMGYSYGDSIIKVGSERVVLKAGDYFSIPVKNQNIKIDAGNNLFIVFRLGFIGQYYIGKTERKGRLSYIDGCSDSLIIYPPRLGDASLNLLYFPKNINQSFHTHPSIRIGCVISGTGISDTDDGANDLSEGVHFCLEEHELHRFKTSESEMRIVAFHPDGDWGPTDENHTMFNRTYIRK
jgi:quercetin dioxygenase-like cupin family protein